jgi:hypothetical protein
MVPIKHRGAHRPVVLPEEQLSDLGRVAQAARLG